MENVINLHKRTIKNVETLCEFTFAMQFAALEVAARVVVCRALGAECKGELRLRGKNGAKSVDDLDWLDCFDFTGGAHYGEAFIRPAGFASFVAVEKLYSELPPVGRMWDMLVNGECELSSVDDTLAGFVMNAATASDLQTAADLVDSHWVEILKEQDCVIADAIFKACTSPISAPRKAA
ncbi:MAG: hypothetical protein IPF44_17200 [Betaproteobacteria bacterium]|nr:hypothetical protein [Betaproteobacteria bacterium]